MLIGRGVGRDAVVEVIENRGRLEKSQRKFAPNLRVIQSGSAKT
jgi:hypothetical protein